MREKTIERRLCNGVKKLGGIAYKFTSPGNSAVPDRLVILPGGRTCLVETKAPGKKPSQLQAIVIRQLQSLGMEVWVIDSPESVDEFLKSKTL